MSNPSKREFDYLNVIIHGLVLLWQDQENIRALIPNVGTSHAYRAGNWLAEIGFSPDYYDLQLQQWGSDRDSIDESLHTLIHAPVRRGLIEQECIVEINFPRPNTIKSYRTVHLDPKLDLWGPQTDEILQRLAASRPGQADNYIHVSNVHIFSYKVNPCSLLNVRLADHPWAPDADPLARSANLHVFASPEVRPRVAHNFDEFHSATSMLSRVEMYLRSVKPMPAYPDQETIDCDLGVPRMVIFEELEDLPSRLIRMADLGELKRKEQDLSLAWQPFEEFADPGSCTTCGGQP